MKKLFFIVSACFLYNLGMAQQDTATVVDTVYVPIEGRGETPAVLEGTWVLKSGIKMKKESETEAASIVETKSEEGQKSGKRITQQQSDNLHYPDKPGISFYAQNETFTGFTGCNKFSGRYEAKGSKLSITTGASTKMECIGQYEEKEFMSKLQKVNNYKVDGGRLELLHGDDVVLVFGRKS